MLCRSLVANLNTEVPSQVQDKQLQIELDAIRQSILTVMEGVRQRSTHKVETALTGLQQQLKLRIALLRA